MQSWEAADFTFTGEQVEKMAIAEHDRWMRERIADGWTRGDMDPKKKTNPYLVPWEDLPPDVAEWDRLFVRTIPAGLASVGLQAVPIPTKPAPEATQPSSLT